MRLHCDISPNRIAMDVILFISVRCIQRINR